MTTLHDLDTPALLLDREVLKRNLRSMAERADRLGVALRPHLKTAKCAEVAAMATRGRPAAITVSTLREAEYFAEHGFDDLVYAVAVVPARLARAAAILRGGVRLRMLTDDPDVARDIGEYGRTAGIEFPVLVELDCGAHRGGVDPRGDTLLVIGRILDGQSGTALAGVLTHAGQAYGCAHPRQIAEVAEQERVAAVSAAERLRDAGLPCDVVSVGSTPTAVCARHLDGVTEMRPGTYVFYDLFQEGLEVCEARDLALSVLASVIGRSQRDGRVLTDAGSLALSQDLSANRRHHRVGYGLVADLAGRRLEPAVRVREVHQEHGFLETTDGSAIPKLRTGSRVRIFPNHACTTAAMFDRYHVVHGGENVVDVWNRVNRW